MTFSSSHWHDLLPRIVSAICLAMISLICILWGGWYFNSLILIIFILASWEGCRVFSPSLKREKMVSYCIVNLLAQLNIVNSHWLLAILFIFTALYFGRALWCLALVLAVGCFSLCYLRFENIWSVIFTISVVCASDTVAYFTGRLIGGAKLAPTISPKKTISGAIGGLLGAAMVGFLIAYYVGCGGSLYGILWGAILGCMAQLGDLSESFIKRRLDVKDTGNILPGHGGVLDRFDGLLLALPVAVVATFYSHNDHFLWMSFL